MSSIKLTQRLGIKYPLLLSPMAGVATPALSSTITNLGGLGSIPISHIDFTNLNSIDQLDKLISKYQVRDKSIVNLNFFCHDPVTEPSEESIDNWKQLYRKVINDDEVIDRIKLFTPSKSFKEFEIDDNALTRLLSCLEKFTPKVVSFHFGIPSISTIEKIQKLGILIFASGTSLKEAVFLHQAGIDGIILQGFEAGGHRGNFLGESDDELLTTQLLFIQVRDYFRKQQNPPFLIPAGGINDDSIVKYYIDNGASGVQVGTVFLGVRESLTSPFFSSIVKKERCDTAMVDLVSGKFARTVRTPFIEALIKSSQELQGKELPGYGYRYNAYKELRGLITGELDVGFYLAGQNYYQINPDLSIDEIFKKLIKSL